MKTALNEKGEKVRETIGNTKAKPEEAAMCSGSSNSHAHNSGFYLHLTCKKHNEKTFIKEPERFNCLDGGCAKAYMKMTLVRTISNGKGGSRGLSKGTYEPPRSTNASPAKEEEVSLLDL